MSDSLWPPWKAAKSCLSKSQWSGVEEPGNQVSGLIHQFPGDSTLRKEGPRRWREKECHLLAMTMSLELCSSMHRTKSRFYFIFNWRIIALQCYAGFCHITTHISHNYMCVCVCVCTCMCVCVCVSSSCWVALLSLPISPLEVITRLGSLRCTVVPLAVCFIHGDIHTSVRLSRFLPPSPSPTVSPSPFSMIVN